MAKTLTKFGVPTGAGDQGILQPKLKYRFRVTLLAGYGGLTESREYTQNVMNVTRPKVNFEEVMIDSYNSKVYVAGKHAWDPVTVVVRDDISNSVSRIVGAQNQRQLNHFEQTAPIAGTDYKFDMIIEALDGSTAVATEIWTCEGCFLTNIDYSESDYATSEPVTVSMTVRMDNCVHEAGDSAVTAGINQGGIMDPAVSPGNAGSPLASGGNG